MREDIKIYNLDEPRPIAEEKVLANRGADAEEDERDLPLGSNRLSAGYLFEERLYYRDKAFEQIEEKDFGLIDTWSSVIEYGKTNLDGHPIYLSEYYLKQFTSTTKQDVYAINFVVDIFEEMVFKVEDYIRKAGSIFTAGSLDFSTIFPLNVNKGWQSPTALYHEHISTMYESFTNDYLSNKHSKVLIFEHFVKYFIDFCHVAAEEVPIFFSSFVQSIHCPININGYTLEIAEAAADDDRLKFTDFIDTPLFEIFRRFAITHGFMIDKNVPWRLIANMNHPKMKAAAQKDIFLGDDYSLQKMFEIMYYNTAAYDIELMKFHLASFYNNYVSFRPYVDVPYEKDCFTGTAMLAKGIAKRSAIHAFASDKSLDVQSPYYAKYNDSFWLNFYYQVKLVENKMDFDISKVNNNFRKYMSNYRINGLESSVKMILTDVNKYRQKQNIKRGTFTDARPDLIIYDELFRGMPPARELEHDLEALPITDVYKALGQGELDEDAEPTAAVSTPTVDTTTSATDTSETTGAGNSGY